MLPVAEVWYFSVAISCVSLLPVLRMTLIVFSYHGTCWPESSTALYFDDIRQVAAHQLDVRRLVFGRVHQSVAVKAKSGMYDCPVLIAARDWRRLVVLHA